MAGANTQQCRICFETSNVRSNALVSACSCTGSVRYVHEKCLLRWFQQRQDLKCELCKQDFAIRAKGLRPVRQWRFPKLHCHMDNLCFMFLMLASAAAAFACVVFWMAAIGCTDIQCIICYVFLPLILIYMVICIVYTKLPKGFCRTFMAINRNWTVVGRRLQKASDDTEESKIATVPIDETSSATVIANMERVDTDVADRTIMESSPSVILHVRALEASYSEQSNTMNISQKDRYLTARYCKQYANHSTSSTACWEQKFDSNSGASGKWRTTDPAPVCLTSEAVRHPDQLVVAFGRRIESACDGRTLSTQEPNT